jgi:predicted CoA-substrate-specific enzyme activase
MHYFAGIDIGSTTIKIVLINEAGNPVARHVCPTGSHFYKHTRAALDQVLQQNNLSRDSISYSVSTGYGRKLFHEADESMSEITANAAGAIEMVGHLGRVTTIINIGGQDLKVIALDDNGRVKNFAMNDKCAAGTGRFLEMTARNLEVEVDALADYHLSALGPPLTINSTCTVFAESEIVGLLAGGNGKAEIIAGIHYSIAKRVVRLAKRLGSLGNLIFFDGGPAMNGGLVKALEDELMKQVVVPHHPQTTTAYGAALIACDLYFSIAEAEIDA